VTPSRASLGGLDWLNFFVANVQTGFGPFIAVSLAARAWTQLEIGQALSLGTVVALVSQLPAGAMIDRLRDKRMAAAAAGVVVAISAMLFAATPSHAGVFLAEALHSLTSAMLAPAMATISLALVGRAVLGARLGRNARFASLGSGIATAVMGACGAYISNQAVFWLTAALMIPALIALRTVRICDLGECKVTTRAKRPDRGRLRRDLRELLTDGRVLGFALCVALFHLANTAMLPLAATEITRQTGSRANLVVAACIIVPQMVVAAVSPRIGRIADQRGHGIVLLAGFAALPVRALLLAIAGSPWSLIAIQVLDGISAAVFGIMLPLVAADLTVGTTRFNLCLGLMGLAVAAGATLSTLLAGFVADMFGQPAAFVVLACCGAMAMLAVPRMGQVSKCGVAA